MIFGSDIDDVICDFSTLLKKVIRRITGYNIEKFNTFNFNIPGYTSKEISEIVNIAISESYDAPVLENNLEYLIKIHNFLKEPILFVTARKESFKDVTLEWLERNVSGYIDYVVRFYKFSGDRKSNYLDKDTKYFVDDYYLNANDVARNVEISFLLDMEYNRNKNLSDNVVVVKNMREVYKIILNRENNNMRKKTPITTFKEFVEFSYLDSIIEKVLGEETNISSSVSSYETPMKLPNKKLGILVGKDKKKTEQEEKTEDNEKVSKVEAEEVKRASDIISNTT